MTTDQIVRWAEDRIEAWNRRDIATVLAHFDEGARFTSPRAAAVVGKATVVGKAALQEYWTAALAKIETKGKFSPEGFKSLTNGVA